MKKHLFISVVFCKSALAFDHIDYMNCGYSFTIGIKNNTQQTCQLTQQIIKQGDIKSKEIPLTLPPGEESKPYKIHDFKPTGPDVLLSYQCGDDKFVTIETLRFTTYTRASKPVSWDIWGRTWYTNIPEYHMIGSILSLSNINAHYETSQEDCSQNIPSSIVWTFD